MSTSLSTHEQGVDSPRRDLGAAFAVTFAASVGTILLSFVGGVLTARFLGADGRGLFAAVSSWTLTLSWASALGFASAMVYYWSVKAAPGKTVVSTALASVPVLGTLGIVLGQVLLPLGFRAQTAEGQSVARLFLLAIPLVLGTETLWALLMGAHRFTLLSWLRMLQPALFVAGLVALLLVEAFTPSTVLGAQVLSYGVTLAVGLSKVVRITGVGRPSIRLTRKGIWYGLRLQGVALGHLVTARLDLMMLPAFVGAASLGYYSIAVNVSSMIVSLFGSLRMVIFPVAASSANGPGMVVVERGFRITFYGGLVTVILLALAAPWLITTVYGQDYAPSVLPLWLMLPGILLFASTIVMAAGLEALGRPGLASLGYFMGAVCSVIGLTLTLPRFGIVGAASTATVSYALTFIVTCVVLHSVSTFSFRNALNVRELRSDLSMIKARIQNQIRPSRVTGGDS